MDLDAAAYVSIEVDRAHNQLVDDLEDLLTTSLTPECQGTTESQGTSSLITASIPSTSSSPSPSSSRTPTPTDPSKLPAFLCPKAKTVKKRRKRAEENEDELLQIITNQVKEEEQNKNIMWCKALSSDISTLTEEQQNIAKKLCRDIIYYGSMQKLCFNTKVVDFN